MREENVSSKEHGDLERGSIGPVMRLQSEVA